MAVGVHDFCVPSSGTSPIQGLEAAVACFSPPMLGTLPREYRLDNPLYGHLMLSWAELMAGRTEDSHATLRQGAWNLTEATRSPYLATMALSFGAAAARRLRRYDPRPRALAEGDSSSPPIINSCSGSRWLTCSTGSANCLDGNVTDGLSEIEGPGVVPPYRCFSSVRLLPVLSS